MLSGTHSQGAQFCLDRLRISFVRLCGRRPRFALGQRLQRAHREGR